MKYIDKVDMFIWTLGIIMGRGQTVTNSHLPGFAARFPITIWSVSRCGIGSAERLLTGLAKATAKRQNTATNTCKNYTILLMEICICRNISIKLFLLISKMYYIGKTFNLRFWIKQTFFWLDFLGVEPSNRNVNKMNPESDFIFPLYCKL